MIELAQLFQDVEAAVVQQEPAVEEIETKAAIINDNVGKANTEIDGAIVKARSRNRKKWICLGLVCKYYPGIGVLVLLQWLLTKSLSAPSYHYSYYCGSCDKAEIVLCSLILGLEQLLAAIHVTSSFLNQPGFCHGLWSPFPGSLLSPPMHSGLHI